MKSGVVGAVSVGFRPIASEPIRGGIGGLRYTEWALLELSCVSVPCDPDALVIARSLGKSGRVLNAQNAASVAALVRCLDKSAEAHADGCAELEKAAKHRERARHHAAQIAASTGDSGDADDDPEDDPGDDPDDDVELVLEAEKVKLQIEIASRAFGRDEDIEAEHRKRMILPVWAKFKGTCSSRVVTATIATRGHLDGQYVDPMDVDFDLYLARGGAVLVSHDGERQVATCTRIMRSTDALVGQCVFPSEGRDPTADAVFEKIWWRQIRCVSAGLSFRRGDPPQTPRVVIRRERTEPRMRDPVRFQT